MNSKKMTRKQARSAATKTLSMTDTMRDFIEGMSVSIDVSTGDHDAGHRYFGTVTEVMNDHSDKHGVTLLVQDAKPNFPTPASKHRPVDADQAQEVPFSADGWALAEKVRVDLDKQSCPDAFMRIAVESIIHHAAHAMAKARMEYKPVLWGVADKNGTLWMCDSGMAYQTLAGAEDFVQWAAKYRPDDAPFTVVPLFDRHLTESAGTGEVIRWQDRDGVDVWTIKPSLGDPFEVVRRAPTEGEKS